MRIPKMRVSIREQLALLILTASLISLAVVSIATWVSNHNFVLSIRSSRLAITASLKAAQLASNLNLMQTTANFIANRIVEQSALERYNVDGNDTQANWAKALSDLSDAISGEASLGQQLLLQAQIFPKNASGPNGANAVMRQTAASLNDSIVLPWKCPDGTHILLGDGQCNGWGYPPLLYPNLTFHTAYYNSTFNQTEAEYDGVTLKAGGNPLLLGPYAINSTYSILSMTMPVVNNTSDVDVLGWLTVVMSGLLLQEVLTSSNGLGSTGETLLVGPATSTNLFAPGIMYTDNQGKAPHDFEVKYVLPLNASDASRHPGHTYGTANPPFSVSQFPALYEVFSVNNDAESNSGAVIRAKNEAGNHVSVGFALAGTDMVDWAVVLEQARSEVWEPINHLRNILLICIFCTAAFMAVISFPVAHMFSQPIRRLRAATRLTIDPPVMTPSRSSFDSMQGTQDGTRDVEAEDAAAAAAALARKEGYKNPVSRWRQKRLDEREARRAVRRKRQFRIPGKVKEHRSCIKDELSDLTTTFNEMSDELLMQYSRLEERVQQRTSELELSKKAAEAANESKTLFIANISHELKTPLNGILGMCAVCMQEDDPVRLKRSLGIIYKSGDLLLNLLNDLLTFSKNQVGQHLTLDEKEFRLRDMSPQLLAIFEKQAKEGSIDLRVQFQGANGLEGEGDIPDHKDHGPAGTGRVKDMILWGDTHRILQVLINLVSNALKFTPSGGSVVVTIRCLPELPDLGSRKGSMNSRQSKQQSSRHRGSDATISVAGARMDTANAINIKDKPAAVMHFHERAPSPPPGKYLYFEFEVRDTGPGIPEDLQNKIFEPFVQGDLGLSKKFGGTGLGLSICSQLATLMRGTMGVSSTMGQGSVFTMKIPLRHLQTRADSTASSSMDNLVSERHSMRSSSMEDGNKTPARHSRCVADESDHSKPTQNNNSHGASHNVPPAPNTGDAQPRLVGLSQPFFTASQPMESPGSQPAAMDQIAAEATRGAKIRVLVAEDNTVNQEVVLRMLKLEDIYDVTVAKDGQEALDRVRESMHNSDDKPYDLIFMDVQMPNVDGLQSTRLIREIGYQAPIVALTAFAEESNIKDCLDSGMNYFLSKPIRRPQLKKVLRQFAPIPEENEDTSASEIVARRGSASQNTTIVMINNVDGRTDLPSASVPHDPQDRPETHEGSRPVSPKSDL
ncbi:hypothetical protein M433DRAFT_76499 [Acidomyces richmondensis BFW]|nr:MAG: hypothetical protein FE78DRAFT_142422 [Acidomyces sp. 'richmondensis']KYG41130.1 hypothetical protein M433DRAFT_76499 [Acidomyces richmondensis BFW]